MRHIYISLSMYPSLLLFASSFSFFFFNFKPRVSKRKIPLPPTFAAAPLDPIPSHDWHNIHLPPFPPLLDANIHFASRSDTSRPTTLFYNSFQTNIYYCFLLLRKLSGKEHELSSWLALRTYTYIFFSQCKTSNLQIFSSMLLLGSLPGENRTGSPPFSPLLIYIATPFHTPNLYPLLASTTHRPLLFPIKLSLNIFNRTQANPKLTGKKLRRWELGRAL